MAEPLVSIHMITYNQAPYIGQAIEGVLRQKVDFGVELVIGEDCSTDGTREIVLGYQAKYPDSIRVVTSDNNVGARKNSYRVMKACRGKYVAFCEGDDYWHHPGKLQKQVDYMESHSECGLIYSSYDVYHANSQKLIRNFIKYRKWEMPKKAAISDIIGNENGISYGILTCTIMVRRALYEQVIESDWYLHQSGHFLMGDIQVWAEISTLGDVGFIPESLATHNIMDESASRTKDRKRQLRFSASCAELTLYLGNKYNFPLSMRTKLESDWHDSLLRLAFYTRDRKLAGEVRRESKALTTREWLLYYGAKNAVLHYPLRAAAFGLRLVGRDRDRWM